MRIMLFPKLIKTEETRPHCLKDCSLVIDGNNFFYDSYEDSKLPYVFGSEANEHARYLRKILNDFKNANVKCYFVFKGGSDSMTKKLQKIKPLEFDFESNYKFVPPVFLKEVCKQVLKEGGLDYATCIMESKDDCLALAQRLGCSILSNDIEFCFKNAPYIPHTTLKYTRNAILCGQYNIEDFLRKHHLTHKKFAIFATLSDTNIFPQNHFSALFELWGISDTNLYIQNKKILQWLSEQPEDNIINNVSQFLTSRNEKEKFLNEMNNILSAMHNHDNQERMLWDYLCNEGKINVNRSDPLWFEKGVMTHYIPIPYIDLCKHKLIQGSSYIEKQGSTDSLMISIDIIKYAFNLLTNFEAAEFSIYQHADSFIKVDAADSNIKKPTYNGTGPVFQNGWNDVKRLKLFEHFLVESDININIVNKLPAEARMLVIALTYFARKKTSEGVDVTKQVYCFIVCHVILRVVSDKRGSLRKMRSVISERDSTKAIYATKQYFNIDKDEAKQIYDEDDLKTMVEAQLCLKHMNYLNTLCGELYKPTVYHRSYNGTFIYKLYHDMRDHNENQFLETLFEEAPSVFNFINMLTTTYKELV